MKDILTLPIIYIFFTFVTSLTMTCLLLKEKIFKKKYVFDDNSEDRKIHSGNIKRTGGLGIAITILLFLIINYYFQPSDISYKILIIYFFSLLFFLIGFVEDLIKNINPLFRLLALLLITLISLIQTKNIISNTDIDFFDLLLRIKIIAILFTTLCILGAANSFNMMDGANGLITFFSISILATISVYASNESNITILNISYIFGGTLIGFLVLNWPKAFIFLGDGGSYLIGSFLCSFLIFASNILESFNFFHIMILMAYPFWEILFTIIRRLKYSNKIVLADNFHLHSLIFLLISNFDFFKKNKTMSNATTSLIVNFIALSSPLIYLFIIPKNNLTDEIALLSFLVFLLIYTFIYILLAHINSHRVANENT